LNGWRKASTALLHGKNLSVPIGEEDGWDLILFWVCGGKEEETFLHFWNRTPTLRSICHHPSLASQPAVGINTQIQKNIIARQITGSQLKLLQSMKCLVPEMTAGTVKK